MTTNEFIKKLEESGYEIEEYESHLTISKKYPFSDYHVCFFRVDIDQQYTLQIFSHNFKYIESNEEREKLYDLAVEYDRTPVEERVEQKKYLLLPKLEDLANGKCPLQRIRRNGLILLPCDYENDELFQQIFTDTDIKKMPAWVNDFIEQGYLIKEEIKDDNEN